MSSDPVAQMPPDLAFLTGGGEATRLILARDWTGHPLGPPATWPESLRTALSLVLNSPESMILAWGKDLTFFFNETYFPLLGPRLPWAMGARFDEVWADGLEQALPIIEDAFAGRSTRYVDLPWKLATDRGEEETWWSFSYSRVLDSAGEVAGLFILTNETTDRVRAEMSIRAAERRNRQILDSATDYAIIATDLTGRVTRWNAGAHRILGWSEAEMLGQPIDQIFTPEDIAIDRPATEMRNALLTGSGNDERWHLPKSGVRFWASGEMMPLRDQDGTVNGFVKVLRDHTDQRIAEERRRQMAERLTSALEIAQLGTLDWNIPARTVAVDRRAREIFALGDAEIVSEDLIFSRIARSDIDRVLASSRLAAAAGKTIDVEYAIELPDGGQRIVLSSGFMVREVDGTPTRMFGTWRDVTQQRQYESHLLRLNQELETSVTLRTAERDRLWETSPDLLVLIDFDGRMLRVNPSWTRILGYAPDELLGHRVTEFIVPEDHPATADAIRVAAVGVLPTIENRYRHKDGSTCWFSWAAAPTGNTIYAIGRDVTADKAAREALRQAEEQLRQSQKVEAVGQLTGGVAHDFNNLLTVIRGSVDLLRRPGLTEERRARYIAAIADTADRATKLTSQLLAFARRQALTPVVFDVGESIVEVRDMLQTLTGSRVAITLDLPTDACCVDADRNQFDTAIVNMAVNARDAMDGEGALTIAVGTADSLPSVRSHSAVPGDFVTVALRDTGTGISDDEIDLIFEPFFSTKGPGHGTGLGLSQVFGFAKQSGGGITVENVGGGGAMFTLYLPRVDACAVPVQVETRARQAVVGQHARILVVEDNPDVGSFATQALSELGYDTTFAADGRSALALLAAGADQFDAVFSDVVMPGMSGIELGEAIAQAYPALPVILTSGYSSVLAENGTHGFELLHKPYSIDGLSRALRKVVDRRARDRGVEG